MPIVTVDKLVEEAMAGRADWLGLDLNIRSTRSNPLSGAGAATVARNGPAVEPIPAVLGGGATKVLLEAFDLYEQTGLPVMLYEAFLMGTVDTATAAFTDGVQAPTRTAGGLSQQIPLSLWMECATDMVSARTVQVTYVDQGGNSGQLSAAHLITTNAVKHSGGFVVLAVPDIGVLDVTAISCSGGATPSGILKFWGVNPVTIVPTTGAATPSNLLAEGVVRRIAAGTELRTMVLGGQTAGRSFGQIPYTVDTP